MCAHVCISCLSMQVWPPLHMHVKNGSWNWLSSLSFFIFGDKVSHWTWSLNGYPGQPARLCVLSCLALKSQMYVTTSVFLYGCWESWTQIWPWFLTCHLCNHLPRLQRSSHDHPSSFAFWRQTLDLTCLLLPTGVKRCVNFDLCV